MIEMVLFTMVFISLVLLGITTITLVDRVNRLESLCFPAIERLDNFISWCNKNKFKNRRK